MPESQRKLVDLKCTDPACRVVKGTVETRADGDIVFRFRCPNGHSQGLSLRHTLTMALKHDPVAVKIVIDNLAVRA